MSYVTDAVMVLGRLSHVDECKAAEDMQNMQRRIVIDSYSSSDFQAGLREDMASRGWGDVPGELQGVCLSNRLCAMDQPQFRACIHASTSRYVSNDMIISRVNI